ncbi:hypothetical protein ACQ4PT_034959 [Festuca glaucescens]
MADGDPSGSLPPWPPSPTTARELVVSPRPQARASTRALGKRRHRETIDADLQLEDAVLLREPKHVPVPVDMEVQPGLIGHRSCNASSSEELFRDLPPQQPDQNPKQIPGARNRTIQRCRNREMTTSSVEPTNSALNNGTRSGVGNVQEAPCLDIEVASSAMGEVKMSLKCSVGPSKFRMPALEAVFKMVESKCLRSYKVLPPDFSIRRLMTEICQCVVERNTQSDGAVIGSSMSLAKIGGEDCCADCFGDCLSSPEPCACARQTGGEYAYTLEGLVRPAFIDECVSMYRLPEEHQKVFCGTCPLERSRNKASPKPCRGHLVRKFIKECWSKCGCNMQCGNRVVQCGITCNLQVFFTGKGTGWGLRTLDELPKGAFVCEYAGEILTNTELHERVVENMQNDRYVHPILLDAGWCSRKVLKEEEALCLDGTFYGNVGRFINHRCCDANLVVVPVEVETLIITIIILHSSQAPRWRLLRN